MNESEYILTEIARVYLFGKIEEERGTLGKLPEYPEHGVKILEELAENGSASACAMLSAFFWAAIQNKEEAVRWKLKALELYRKQAQEGNPEAQYACAKCLLHSKYKKEGIELLEKSAEQGYANAMLCLGEAYAEGKRFGVKANREKAVEWYKKAAESGYEHAYILIAQLYFDFDAEHDEEPTNEDIENQKAAFYWFQKAAKCDVFEALTPLGWCYLDGIGVEKDEIKAFALCRIGDNTGCRITVSEMIKEKIWCPDDFLSEYNHLASLQNSDS